MGHAPVLVPDYTLFIQLGIFFASYFVMRALVFKPYLALLAERRAKTVGLKEKALHAREKAAKLQTDYEAHMKQERKKVAAWTDEERKKIADEERAIVEAARGEVAESLATSRAKILADTEQARRDLMPLVNEYSSQIASKLLGRKVNVVAAATSKGQRENSEQVVPR